MFLSERRRLTDAVVQPRAFPARTCLLSESAFPERLVASLGSKRYERTLQNSRIRGIIVQ